MFSRSFALHFASIIIACVVQGLAIVNFGILSIWVNSTAASLALIYHITLLVLNRRRNRSILNSQFNIMAYSEGGQMKHNRFPSDLKMPSPTYVPPPPYGSRKPEPNRRPVTIIVIPNNSTECPNNSKPPPPSGPFYTLTSFCSIIGTTIITLIGLGMTVEVSIHGSKSLLPAERARGMTFPWNMKIQKAQCTFLGVQLLLCLVAVFLCKMGRDEIERVEEEKREEAEYGFGSPRSAQTLDHWVGNGAV